VPDGSRRTGTAAAEIVLCGSSIMEGWTTSAADLAPLRTRNIAVGGTRVEDWAAWVRMKLEPLRPEAVVLYVGSNNLNGGDDSEDGIGVARKAVALLDDIRGRLPRTRLYYVSIAPSIARKHVWGEAEACNRAVAEAARTRPHLRFIDCTAALLAPDGSLRKDFYVEDGLHFTPKAYAVWKAVIGPVLHRDLG